jgi:hypothetical protein
MADAQPFIFQKFAAAPRGGSHIDELTSDEPLPATVEMDCNGVPTGATRLTEIARETTDDQ